MNTDDEVRKIKRIMGKKVVGYWRSTTTGILYPMIEAELPFPIQVYKMDAKKAKLVDAQNCVVALGAMRNKLIEDCFIGSGKDAYIAFKANMDHPAYAMHYTINQRSAKVRDYFDTHKDVTQATITMSPVTPGRTHAHRKKLNKRRYEEIKNGAEKRSRPAGKKNRTKYVYRQKADIDHVKRA